MNRYEDSLYSMKQLPATRDSHSYPRSDIHDQLEGQDPALLKMTPVMRTWAAELDRGVAWFHVC